MNKNSKPNYESFIKEMNTKDKNLKVKFRYADVGEMVMILEPTFPVIRFVQQEFDKRQYWLEITYGISKYYSSINLTQWDNMPFETKVNIVNLAKSKLLIRTTGNTLDKRKLNEYKR